MNLAKLELPEQVAAIQPYIIICEGEEFAYRVVGPAGSIEAGINLAYGHFVRAGENYRDGVDCMAPKRYIFHRIPQGSDGDDGYESYFTIHAADM